MYMDFIVLESVTHFIEKAESAGRLFYHTVRTVQGVLLRTNMNISSNMKNYNWFPRLRLHQRRRRARRARVFDVRARQRPSNRITFVAIIVYRCWIVCRDRGSSAVN